MSHSMVLTETTFRTAKARSIAALLSVIAAVALPQLFHVLGAVTGLGAALGQTFLPMHLPILLVGMLAGPVAGLAAGLASPVMSFALSGMPAAALLPFMVVELGGYGLAAGLMMRTRTHVFVKLVLAQLAGRALRAAAVLLAFYGLGVQTASVASIWTGVVQGLPGLLLQWCLVPLLMYWAAGRRAEHAGY